MVAIALAEPDAFERDPRPCVVLLDLEVRVIRARVASPREQCVHERGAVSPASCVVDDGDREDPEPALVAHAQPDANRVSFIGGECEPVRRLDPIEDPDSFTLRFAWKG